MYDIFINQFATHDFRRVFSTWGQTHEDGSIRDNIYKIQNHSKETAQKHYNKAEGIYLI